MARIYIASNREDAQFVHYLSLRLSEDGHEISTRSQLEGVGTWKSELEKEILRADILLGVFSENGLLSKWLGQELSILRGFATEVPDKKLFVPIAIGEVAIPEDLIDYRYLQAKGPSQADVDEIVGQVRKVIGAFIGRRTAAQDTEEKKKAIVEAKASTFMSEAMTNLTARETKFSRRATWWYGIGYISLLLGVFASGGIAYLSIGRETQDDWALAVLWGIKSVLIIGLIVALSKYAFSLGKSFMAESLKNADRKHAISFGNFFMDAFSDSVKPEDVKEVFQDWNMSDSNTSFDRSGSTDFDPKDLEKLIELIKAIKK